MECRLSRKYYHNKIVYLEISMASWYIKFGVEYRLSRKFYGTMVNRIIVWNIVCLETSMVSCTYTAVQNIVCLEKLWGYVTYRI